LHWLPSPSSSNAGAPGTRVTEHFTPEGCWHLSSLYSAVKDQLPPERPRLVDIAVFGSMHAPPSTMLSRYIVTHAGVVLLLMRSTASNCAAPVGSAGAAFSVVTGGGDCPSNAAVDCP
jgi:hypothetical protein